MNRGYQLKQNYHEMCIANELFTCGGNRQYAVVMNNVALLTEEDFATQSDKFKAVVYMTWICSDVDAVSVESVKELLLDIFAE